MTGLFARCAGCGVAMDHEPGRGKATKYCGESCRRTETAKARKAAIYPECSVEGCSKSATRKAAAMCETHYYRQRRTGMTDLRPVILSNSVKSSADRRVIAETVEHSNGYLLTTRRTIRYREVIILGSISIASCTTSVTVLGLSTATGAIVK